MFAQIQTSIVCTIDYPYNCICLVGCRDYLLLLLQNSFSSSCELSSVLPHPIYSYGSYLSPEQYLKTRFVINGMDFEPECRTDRVNIFSINPLQNSSFSCIVKTSNIDGHEKRYSIKIRISLSFLFCLRMIDNKPIVKGKYITLTFFCSLQSFFADSQSTYCVVSIREAAPISQLYHSVAAAPFLQSPLSISR